MHVNLVPAPDAREKRPEDEVDMNSRWMTRENWLKSKA